MEKTTDIIIKAEERYGESCFGDFCNCGSNNKNNSSRGPQGFVEIYEVSDDEKKKLIGKSNLVVYSGRETVAVRLMDKNASGISSTKDEFISWFGLGSGGVAIADPFTPISPDSVDTDLSTEIPISITDSTCGDFHDGAYYKCQLDSLEVEQDTYNNDRYLILKSITTIGNEYANGYIISEAGLFTSESTDSGYAGPFHLFARITFPSIVKDVTRRLIFIWYIFV